MPNKVAVIGLGFVGVPLVKLLIKNNYDVIGVDIDKSKIASLINGESYLSDLSNKEISKMINSGCFHPTSDYQTIKNANTIIICVPTPLRNKQPDLSYVTDTIDSMSSYIQKDTLIILESSTYPGTTEKLIQPLLEKLGFTIGEDIYLAYSPERIDPGNNHFTLESTPKVISGVTEKCLDRIKQIYNKIFQTTVPVSSPAIAEFTKILENSQRLINISFMNEVNLLANKLNINMWEAIEAAKTKPVGFSPYYPGPGIGGHCIPIDPFYLTWVGMQEGVHLSMIHQAGIINEMMPYRVVNEIMQYLKITGNKNGKVGIIGLTYKKDVNDLRESPAWKITELLAEKNICTSVYDPFFKETEKFDKFEITPDDLDELDLTVILVDHSNIDWDIVVKHSKQIIDTRNITKDYSCTKIKRI